jgi:hypothetical protein
MVDQRNHTLGHWAAVHIRLGRGNLIAGLATTGRELCYPTQAKKRLEWGTQLVLLVHGVVVKAAVS